MAKRPRQHALGNIAHPPPQFTEPERSVLEADKQQHAPFVADAIKHIADRATPIKFGIGCGEATTKLVEQSLVRLAMGQGDSANTRLMIRLLRGARK